ncbi:terminase large subunit [Microbacterium phage Megan]|uniref:Terminase n=1 Tax=Microbacterium phage Megan TaxID=2656551 RepID=A0A649VK94_9CAUD|nr:terminase large subunit [Microbacterium phage Megan]QGJ92681.1 terminase [Microbacterium phage Megan]
MTDLDALLASLRGLTPEQIADAVMSMPADLVQPLLGMLGQTDDERPQSPAEQALALDEGYVLRDHLRYLSDRLAAAVERVEAGENVRMAVSMPPRTGKSTMVSTYFVVWALARNPRWKVGLISHDPSLAIGWSRTVRGIVEANGAQLGLSIAPDAGAVSEWQTPERGGVTARSAPGQSITGRGFNVLLIDDIVRDYAAAHSEVNRKAVWEWWTANAVTRLEPPSLVIAIGTRWHEDDFIARLLSDDYEGDPSDWEVVSFPAIAEANDVLGREVGAPLLSPLDVNEDVPGAIARWADIKRTVGSYNWSSQFQQAPAPAQGAIFNMGWWRYWTLDPERATDDGKIRLIVPEQMLGAKWLDSWDMAFKDKPTSDYVVGQRWVRHGANRFLMLQSRDRRDFPATLAEMQSFKTQEWGHHVHLRLVEDKANGTAVIATLHDKISGLKPINPTTSKEARARAVTPEVESGNVYLPNPAEYPWVSDLLSELRSFPTGAHDDQVDALTQALMELREDGTGSRIGQPQAAPAITINRASAARTSIRRGGGLGR